VNGADTGMVQRRGRLRFSLEARQCLWVFCDIVRQEFQRHVAVQPRIFGLVDHAHTAAAELFGDAVMRNGLADEGVGVRHSGDIIGCPPRQVNESGQSASSEQMRWLTRVMEPNLELILSLAEDVASRYGKADQRLRIREGSNFRTDFIIS